MKKKSLFLYILGLLLLTLVGAFLLQLPGICVNPDFSLIDALFTSASAVTLTGLSVTEDLGTTFTFTGQFVLLLLFQLGGLLFVISSLYFASLLNFRTGILPQKQNYLLAKISLRVTAIMLLLEIPAIIAVFSLWGRRLDLGGTGTKIFYSAFHAVSAFTNTGFTLFKGGFSHSTLNELYILHLALAAFIFLGALGFPAIYNLISIKNLRARMLDPRKDWELNTRVSLYAALVLSFFGAITFYLLERNYLLTNQKTVEAGITAIFHAISARSGGFSSFAVKDFSILLLSIFMLLMFIGGSSASMAGGIKVSTIYLLLRRNSLTKNKGVNVKKILLKVVIISIILIFLISWLLHFSEVRHSYFSLLFETVSAFSSSGFSLGITTSLSSFGKFVIIISMLSGRILFPGMIYYLLANHKESLGNNILPG